MSLRIICAAFGMLIVTPALAQTLPSFPVEKWCDRVSATMGKSEMIYGGCIDQEQAAYDELKVSWDGVPAATQRWCLQVAKAGGSGSYSLLQSCVEMEDSARQENGRKTFRR